MMPAVQVVKLIYPEALPEPFLLAGFVDYPAGMVADRFERHPFAQAVLVLRGQFFFEGPGTGVVVGGPNEALVVPTGAAHRYGVHGEADTATFMVNFHVPSLAQFGHAAEAFGGPAEGPWRVCLVARDLEPLVEQLRRECEGPRPASTAVMHALVNLFLARLAEARLRREAREVAAAVPLPVRRALRVIETCYATPLALPDLARAAELGVSRFSELFRRHLGVSPMAYLMDYRLRTAAVLLRSSGFAVADIARNVGFSSPQYFARRFGLAFRKSPSEYRATGGDNP